MYRILLSGGENLVDYGAFSLALYSVMCDKCLFEEDVEITVQTTSKNCLYEFGSRFAKEKSISIKPYFGPFIKMPISCVVKFTDLCGQDDVEEMLANENLMLGKTPVCVIPYRNYDLSAELEEGISKKGGEFVFDWENDTDSDIVSFYKTFLHTTVFKSRIRVYGYNFKKYEGSKVDKNAFIDFVKKNPYNNNVVEMVSKMVDDFYTSSYYKHFDYILKLPSSSRLNDLVTETIVEDYDSTKIVNCTKLPSSEIVFDWDKFRRSVERQGNDFYAERKWADETIAKVKASPTVSMKKLRPSIRRYFSNFIGLGEEKIKPNSSVLIVDDVFTSGKTVGEAIDKLIKAGFIGDITILTLFNNR